MVKLEFTSETEIRLLKSVWDVGIFEHFHVKISNFRTEDPIHGVYLGCQSGELSLWRRILIKIRVASLTSYSLDLFQMFIMPVWLYLVGIRDYSDFQCSKIKHVMWSESCDRIMWQCHVTILRHLSFWKNISCQKCFKIEPNKTKWTQTKTNPKQSPTRATQNTA